MKYKHELLALVLLVMASGCGDGSVTGGTTGILRIGGEVGTDVQTTVYTSDGAPLGFGVTRADGSFKLVTNGATGPLWLEPGDYRFTVESVGAEVEIPAEFSRVETTPLKVTVTDDKPLTLDVTLSNIE
jgi:hypothetical protein